jgi:hypothetical protein
MDFRLLDIWIAAAAALVFFVAAQASGADGPKVTSEASVTACKG